MATAPDPNAPEVQITPEGAPIDRAAAVRAWVSVLVHAPEGRKPEAPYEVAYKVHPMNVPMTEMAIFKKATKFTPIELLSDFDEVGICAFWFLGRRLAGEWNLTWDLACEQWPMVLDGSELEVMENDGTEELSEATDPQL